MLYAKKVKSGVQPVYAITEFEDDPDGLFQRCPPFPGIYVVYDEEENPESIQAALNLQEKIRPLKGKVPPQRIKLFRTRDLEDAEAVAARWRLKFLEQE